MKCHICKRELCVSNYKIMHPQFYCGIHPHTSRIFLDKITYKCFEYHFCIKNNILLGSKIRNVTKIINYLDGHLISTSWIDIELDNLPEDIPKLYNRLMKLQAFT